MAPTVLRNVFVYGSLLAPEVVLALLHRMPRSSLAVVHDYKRYSIRDRIYPAVSISNGNKVFGKGKVLVGGVLAFEVPEAEASSQRQRGCKMQEIHPSWTFPVLFNDSPTWISFLRDIHLINVLHDLTDQELKILDEFEDTEYVKSIVPATLLNAHDLDGVLVDNGPLESPNDAAQDFSSATSRERVSNALTLASADNSSNGNNTILIPPDTIVGITSLETEVSAYMYIWSKKKDPNLVGNWDYEVWRAKHLTQFLEKYTSVNKSVNTSVKRGGRK